MEGLPPYSSSLTQEWTYDVFLNFRGTDTRFDFTRNLYNALHRKGILTFMDDEGLRGGQAITPALLKAIQESRIAITIFSRNYASFTFCLDELVKILECIKEKGRLVLPVFYGVDPSEVRNQRENYRQEFAKHEKRFRNDEEKVRKWRQALQDAANLSGLHFKPGHKYESHFIEEIVKEVSRRINRSLLHIADFPVGLESRVPEVISLLDVGSNERVQMVGICGIGGIGKQQFWDVVATDLRRMVSFPQRGNLDGKLAQTDNIVLIPKTYSPLAYKVISKTLTNRLREIMLDLITRELIHHTIKVLGGFEVKAKQSF